MPQQQLISFPPSEAETLLGDRIQHLESRLERKLTLIDLAKEKQDQIAEEHDKIGLEEYGRIWEVRR